MIDELVKELELYENLLALLLGMPRLFVMAQVAPFMGSTVLTGQMRTAAVFACYMVLHPALVAQVSATDIGSGLAAVVWCAAVILKECLLGLFLGFLSGFLFWAIMSAGFFVDNQRGASMASDADPLSGEQSSPFGTFFLQSMVYFFFSSGAFLAFLGLVYGGYEVWPVMELLPLSAMHRLDFPLFFARQVAWLVLMMLLLSGPVVVACLLTDVSLGLINRFASQLNVYVLAMPIKSGVAIFLMLVYFGMLMADLPQMFGKIAADFRELQGLLAP